MADRITVIGNIGQEPTRRTTPSGEVVEFSVAHNPRVRMEDGAWQDGETVWYRVSAWDRLGSSAESALRRGQRVIVQGWLREREWTGQDGLVRLSRDLRASAIGHDISQRAGGVRPVVPSPGPSAPVPQQPAESPAPPAPSPAAGDWGAPPPAQEPAPAGWTTAYTAEQETPF